jgi:hypothetical protein
VIDLEMRNNPMAVSASWLTLLLHLIAICVSFVYTEDKTVIRLKISQR